MAVTVPLFPTVGTGYTCMVICHLVQGSPADQVNPLKAGRCTLGQQLDQLNSSGTILWRLIFAHGEPLLVGTLISCLGPAQWSPVQHSGTHL